MIKTRGGNSEVARKIALQSQSRYCRSIDQMLAVLNDKGNFSQVTNLRKRRRHMLVNDDPLAVLILKNHCPAEVAHLHLAGF